MAAHVSVIDIAVILVLVSSLLFGWLRGILRPLITWAFIVAGLVIGFGHPGAAADFAPTPGIRPFMGLAVVAVFAIGGWLVARTVAPFVYRRIPALRTIDRVGGLLVGGAAALISLTFLLGTLVTIDGVASPVTAAATVSSTQIAQIQQFLGQHPEAKVILDPGDLSSVASRLGTTTTTSASIGQLSSVLGVLRAIHGQVVQSHVAPIIFGFAERLPIVGRGRSWPSR
jgi:uncharacterized membrane protein required for colicin V production